VAVSEMAPRSRLETLEREGVQVLVVEGSPRRVSLDRLLDILGKFGFLSVMIEGGAEINASALQEGIVDKALIFLAPILIGGKAAPTAVGGDGIASLTQAFRLHDTRVEALGDDILVEGYLRKPTAGL